MVLRTVPDFKTVPRFWVEAGHPKRAIFHAQRVRRGKVPAKSRSFTGKQHSYFRQWKNI